MGRNLALLQSTLPANLVRQVLVGNPDLEAARHGLMAAAAPHSQGDLLSLSHIMKRAHSLMANVVEPALMDRGFTYVQYVVLLWVRQGIAVTSKDIASQLRYNSGALSRVIDQLAHRGLLARVRRNHDRRKVELQLTPAAWGTIDGLIDLIGDRLNRALANFSGSELQDLQRLLVKLATTLQSAI